MNSPRRRCHSANLLTHTAGLTVHGFPGYAINEKLPTLPQVLDGAEPANTAPVRVDMEPGTKFRYSGGGTTIAQLAIMDIEKKPFPQIAGDTVLKPLGRPTLLQSAAPGDWRKKPASCHRPDGNLVEGNSHYPEMQAAGLDDSHRSGQVRHRSGLSLAGRSNKCCRKRWQQNGHTFHGTVGLGFFVKNTARHSTRARRRTKALSGIAHEQRQRLRRGGDGELRQRPSLREVLRSIAREYAWDDSCLRP